MTRYKELYFKLFGVIADAIDDLEKGDVEGARNRLIRVEQEAEEQYLEEI